MINLEVPEAFEPLLTPARYKGAHGGRGGAKSHFFAEQMIVRCYSRQTRAVCIREVQNSIKDSVKQLLVDKIAKLGLEGFFNVLETEIRGQNGSHIIFRGMQSYNADTIKSLEGYDIAWIEEAQTLSEHSFELLRPTIRKADSEIWASWNPRHRTDAIDQFFRGKHRHPEAIVVEVNWRDNPWFPDVLRKEMVRDRLADPEGAEHIWDGHYGMQQGAILARLIDRADKEGRINDRVIYEPLRPIEISGDLGFRDTTAWWFWQRRIGGYVLLDFDADAGLHADEWCDRINNRLTTRGWKLGKVWLPHDARNKTFAARETAVEVFLKRFGGPHVGVVPVSKTPDRINAARMVVRQCEFHTRCETGLDGLRAWEYEWNPETKAFSREPVHNWASHPSDAFSYGCQVMQTLPPPTIEPEQPRLGIGPYAKNTASLNDLWALEGRG